MLKTYELAHLADALGGKRLFGRMLKSTHEMRDEGIFVTSEARDAEWRFDYGVDGALLCPPGGNTTAPVLLPEFTERQLLQFLTIRSDIAFELERAYTNDKTKPVPKPDDGTPYPLDERALAEIDGLVPDFAGMLRRLLSKGGKWWVDDAGQSDISESAANQAVSVAPAGAIESEPAGVTGVLRHSTKAKGRDILDPVIELAKSKCIDPLDTAQVLAQLQVLAQEEHPPLLASTADGIKYEKKGVSAYLTRDALNKRLHPERRQKRR